MLFGADDVGYILFRHSSVMWLLAVVLIDMYAVPTLLRWFATCVTAPVAAMVALTRALLAIMMTRGVQMGLICCIFRLLGVVKCAFVVFCALFFVVLALLFGLLLANMLSDPNDATYILFCCCLAARLLTVVLMNMCVVPALLSVLIGVYGGLLPGVATPVAATSTLTRASLATMMT
ncbi:hypothetical protein Hanom_Chr10g00916381 [Helianthus anomalus]